MKPRFLVSLVATLPLVDRDRVEVLLRGSVLNLFDRDYAYNFGNPFSGTHFGAPHVCRTHRAGDVPIVADVDSTSGRQRPGTTDHDRKRAGTSVSLIPLPLRIRVGSAKREQPNQPVVREACRPDQLRDAAFSVRLPARWSARTRPAR